MLYYYSRQKYNENQRKDFHFIVGQTPIYKFFLSFEDKNDVRPSD